MPAPLNPTHIENIQHLSKRVIAAQKNIRILDSIKWDPQTREDFFKHKGKKLPAVDKDYYLNKPLPFHPEEKKREFNTIIQDSVRLLGKENAVTLLLKRQCNEYIQAIQLLQSRGTPAFYEYSKQLYGCPTDPIYDQGPRLSDISEKLLTIQTARS